MNESKLFTGSDLQKGITLHTTAKAVNGLGNGQENWAYHHDTTDSDSDVGSHANDAITGQPQHADEEKGMTCGVGTHSIILDISTTNFADMVTVKTLKNVCVRSPVSLNLEFVWNNVNRTQVSNYASFLEIIQGEKAKLIFYALRYSETMNRLIWTSI